MKFSNLMIILLIALGFYTCNQIEKIEESLIKSYDEDYNRYRYWERNDYSNSVNNISDEEANKKMNAPYINAGMIGVILVILFFVLKINEDKTDPIKNLERLKDNNLISESEFEEKIEITKNIKYEKYKIKKQNKLIKEITNLKEKGILTELEFQDKLEKIKNSFENDLL